MSGDLTVASECTERKAQWVIRPMSRKKTKPAAGHHLPFCVAFRLTLIYIKSPQPIIQSQNML